MIPGIVAAQILQTASDAPEAPSAADVVYLGADYDATDQTTYTFAGADLGAAAANRVIIAAMKLGNDSGGGNAIGPVTINGVTATEVTVGSAINIVPIGLFYAEVPTGATGDVVITAGASAQNCALHLWAVYGLADPAPQEFFAASNNTSGTSLGSVITVEEAGFIVGAWGVNHADLDGAWTGLIEEAERVTGEQTFEAASSTDMAAEFERSISVTHAAATHRRIVCGAWGAGDGSGAPPDVTAPILSSATGTETGATTADLSVSTDEGNGTLYWVVTQAVTTPSKAQVKAGQNHAGAAADDSGSQAVSGTGVQNAGATGLDPETEFWAHFMHEDAATNQSDVATSSSFTTTATAPLDGLTTTGAWSMSRLLYSAYSDDLYEDVSAAVATLYDQSGNNRDLTEATNRPAVATAGPNSRASASFDGTNDKLRGAAISDFIAAGAGYIIMSGVVDAITTNSASVFSNDVLWTTSSGFLAIHLKSAGTVHAYNWDGNADSVSDAISTGDAVVVEWRHDGGNIMLRINKGTWQSDPPTASGNTSTMTGLFTIGAHTSASIFTDMHFVEGAAFSTVPDEATRDALVDDMMDHIGAV